MTDTDKDPLSELLSSFALGPAWARATGNQAAESQSLEKKFAPRRDERGTDDRRGGQRDRGTRGEGDRGRQGGRDREGRDGGRRFQDRGSRFETREPSRPQEAPPAEGVTVTLIPDPQAVHLIGKEIHQVARVYALYDVARILLAERARCRAVFDVQASQPALFRGRLDESIFLTRSEALRHLWNSELREQFIEEETIEVDPPAGNFQAIARCGLSGVWLGPPNFHSYQVNLRRLHRERFAHLPFELYASKVRTERGEDAVNAWLETTRHKTRWRLKGETESPWIDERTEVLASIPPTHLSPSLMTSLKITGNHARNHPAILIPAVCRAIEAEHLPVFKRQGKLLTGPARPHPLPEGAVLAQRPGIMVEWIRNNKPAKLEGLWKAVLPEGGTAPPAEFAADLFWLLHQGHILLFTDDTLVVQEIRPPLPPPEPKSAKKKKSKSDRQQPAPGDASDESGPSSQVDIAPASGDTSHGDVSAQTGPADGEEMIPMETIPAETIPAETIPAETAPVETAPEQTAPEQTAPEQTTPEQSVPEQTVPKQTVPEQSAPEQTVPVETTAGQMIEAETVPVETIAAPTTADEMSSPETPAEETPSPDAIPAGPTAPAATAEEAPDTTAGPTDPPSAAVDPPADPAPPLANEPPPAAESDQEISKNPPPGVDDPPAV